MFSTNAQSRFASVVVDGVLGPPRLARHSSKKIELVSRPDQVLRDGPQVGAISAVLLHVPHLQNSAHSDSEFGDRHFVVLVRLARKI